MPGISALSDKAAPRPTGISLPFKGQPVQGLSGIKNMKDGTFLTLTDNGFGSKANSPDAMLMFHVVKPDWKSGAVERVSTTFLHDPDRKVPFRIVNENTAKRYLTGADFDIESIQPIGDALWFGDEFGPVPDQDRQERQGAAGVRDHGRRQARALARPSGDGDAGASRPGEVRGPAQQGLRGHGGLARRQVPLSAARGPAVGRADEQAREPRKARPTCASSSSTSTRATTPARAGSIALEAPANAIGDFNLIDANSGLIIERDDSEGDPALACAAGAPKPDCFNVPAKFKRIYKVDLGQADADGFVKKVGYIDLMDIEDPNKVARQGGKDGKFTFPFFTIENVDVVDGDHIIVGNDNNLPFSSGRALGKSGRQRADHPQGHRPLEGEVTLLLRVDRLPALQHVDEGLDLPSSPGLGLHVLGAEDERKAVLGAELVEHAPGLGLGVDGGLQIGRDLHAPCCGRRGPSARRPWRPRPA